jgi:hypothetical protein
MTMSRDWHSIVCHRLITVDNQIRFDIVFRARHFVTFAGDEAAFVAHGWRCANDFATVIGVVTKAN